MKITDSDVKKELNKPNSTYYDLKKREPRLIELVKMGMAAERALKPEFFEELIKKENKKAQ